MRDLALIILVALVAESCGTTAVTKITVRERYDSLIVRHDTIRVRDARSDSLDITPAGPGDAHAFKGIRASIDTTVRGVGISASYEYPPDRWGFDVGRPDTIVKWRVRDSLIERPYEVEVVPFWVKLVLALAVIAVVGMTVATLKR